MLRNIKLKLNKWAGGRQVIDDIYDISSITVVEGKYVKRDVESLRNSEKFKELARKMDKIIGDI